ncbi:MAG: AMP-binding protein, partial [Myxococcota bacterium]|nr:AMP-binding protein [Myxococcota bacterium]
MSLAAPWISARAAITPERTALELDGATLDYGRLQARAERLAAGLRARGVGEADLVAALLPAGVDFVALLHAVDLCDAALLPLNLRLTPRELAYQLRDSRAALLVHDDGERVAAARSAAEAADGLACARVSQLTAGAGEAPALAKRDGSATLAVLYTSG